MAVPSGLSAKAPFLEKPEMFTLIAYVIVLAFMGLAFYLMIKSRHKVSTTLILGATDHMLNQEKKRASQEVVQQLSGQIRHISKDDVGDNLEKNRVPEI